MESQQGLVMDETEYAATLLAERHMYAWTLQQYGHMTASEAQAQASAFYAYQTADVPLRELVFHEDAWHWAMLTLLGECYWRQYPEFEQVSPAYDAECERYRHASLTAT